MAKKSAAKKNKKLVLGLPVGSLRDATIEIFKKAGFIIQTPERSFFPSIDDPEIECILIRPQEIPVYVEKGVLDVGITGKDWIEETGAKVTEVAELVYSKGGFNSIKLVLAVPSNSRIKNLKDLKGKRIATELVNVTKKYLQKNKINAEVEFSWGATESKPPKLVDAIAELTDTGRSLSINNLRVIKTILESTTRIVANNEAWADKWKRRKIENIVMLVKGSLAAQSRVGLKMNVEEDRLSEVVSIIPALREPTVASLSENGWVSVEVVLEEKLVRDLIPRLKAFGVEGIIEYPLNKIIY